MTVLLKGVSWCVVFNMSLKIFCRYAALGEDLSLEENVGITIDSVGRIESITSNVYNDPSAFSHYFKHHILLPKFINSHTHLGDAILKDRAWNLSLKDAVGPNGLKFKCKEKTREQRIKAIRNTIKEMISTGISTCIDFREGGEDGVKELVEAAKDLPIDIRIFGRPTSDSDLSSFINEVNGIGYSTPLDYPVEIIKDQTDQILNQGKLISTHIGEDPEIIHKAIVKHNISDLQVALKVMKPSILVHLNYTELNEMINIPDTIFIVFCPRSNAYFKLKFPPLDFFLKRDHLIGLGTDNVMVTSPNILDELRWTLFRLKEQNIDISLLQALKMITTNASQVLPIESGCIKVGFWADLLVVDLKSNRTIFSKDPITSVLFRSNINDFVLNMFHGLIINYDSL